MGWRGDAQESPPALILATWVFPAWEYPHACPPLSLPSLNNQLFPASWSALCWREVRVVRGVGLHQPRRDLLATMPQGADGDGAIPGAWPFQLWLAGFPPISLRKFKKNQQTSDEKDLILTQNREDRGSDVLKKGK